MWNMYMGKSYRVGDSPSKSCTHHRFLPLFKPTSNQAWPPYTQYIIPMGQDNLSFLPVDMVAFVHLLSLSSFCFTDLLSAPSVFFFFSTLFFTFLLNRYPAGYLSLFIWKCARLFLTWAFFFLVVLFHPSSSFFVRFFHSSSK